MQVLKCFKPSIFQSNKMVLMTVTPSLVVVKIQWYDAYKIALSDTHRVCEVVGY